MTTTGAIIKVSLRDGPMLIFCMTRLVSHKVLSVLISKIPWHELIGLSRLFK